MCRGSVLWIVNDKRHIVIERIKEKIKTAEESYQRKAEILQL